VQGAAGTQPYVLEGFEPHKGAIGVVAAVGQNTIFVQPMEIDQNVALDRVVFPVHFSGATNSTGTYGLTLDVGLYKTTTGSNLTSAYLTRFVTTVTHSGTANSVSNVGLRIATFPWTTTIVASNYWMAFRSSTSSAGANASFSNLVVSQINSSFSGPLGANTFTSMQSRMGQGVYATTSSTINASIAISGIRGVSSADLRSPILYFQKGTYV
jgi:hypothetical protein